MTPNAYKVISCTLLAKTPLNHKNSKCCKPVNNDAMHFH